MCPRKRASKIPLASGPVGDLVRFLIGPGRTLVLGLVIVTGFGGAWYWGWQRVHGDVLTSTAYTLSPDDIVVTNRPDWMGFDIREKVFRDASLQQKLSIMDRDLNERIAAAFSLHPWVAKVNRVSKRYPGGVDVDLEYRRPVCVVETCSGLIPVDVEGNALPAQDIPESQKLRYPRLVCPDLSTPQGLFGDQWGDPRVLGAARIADAMGDRWKSYRLRLIEPIPPGEGDRAGDTLYRMRTQSHSIVIWRRAPGMEISAEPTAADKIAYLDEQVRLYGNLDGPNGRRELDVVAHILNQRSQ